MILFDKRLEHSMLSYLLRLVVWIGFLGTFTVGSSPNKLDVVVGVDGGTESIRACCFDARTGEVIGKACAVPYTTYHPLPGWAEQDPKEWYKNLGQAVRTAVATTTTKGKKECRIKAICLDTTCCSVVALDTEYEPLRHSLLWMDARSAPQTEQILKLARGDPALEVNCGGDGPISAEWMTPKSMWIKQNEPDIWNKAKHICEYQDYLNYKLTGVMCASSCNAAARWHWDGDACLQQNDPKAGRPLSLYKKLGMPELAEKLPQICFSPGTLIGNLTPEAAIHLGLPEGTPVAQGGPDAFVGMVGLGCINPGQLCLITGSSHLHCVVASKPNRAKGIWGAYKGAPLEGINFAEGGQSSTGSIIRWAKNLFGGDDEKAADYYKTLDDEAAQIPPGCEGLVALETFQGSRTPVTDPLARGALVGLTLRHTRSHIWRAFLEAVCFGTRACIEGLVDAGHDCQEVIVAGGATRSPLWLQMHADVTGKPFVVCENTDGPLLGCAILASVGAGIHPSVQDAVSSMVRIGNRVEPNAKATKTYTELYKEVYKKVSPAVRPVVHAIAALRGGSDTTPVIISPSLLACDWADIKGEVRRCIESGVDQLHVDVFDGVFLDSPNAFSFGPQMVKAIRKSCNELNAVDAVIDLHMCVERPERFVQTMAESGATRFIFQWEAMPGKSDSERVLAALAFARNVQSAGMRCGISISPSTPTKVLYPLLKFGLIDLVNVLAVKPGFGGQTFQVMALDKVRELVQWRNTHKQQLLILVDGGVNTETSPQIIDAGADILVAGSFLFHRDNLLEGVVALKTPVLSL